MNLQEELDADIEDLKEKLKERSYPDEIIKRVCKEIQSQNEKAGVLKDGTITIGKDKGVCEEINENMSNNP